MILGLAALMGCASTPAVKTETPQDRRPSAFDTAFPPFDVPAGKTMAKLSADRYPRFTDDEGLAGLQEAIKGSLAYLGRAKRNKSFTFDSEEYSAFEIAESLREFSALIERLRGDEEALNTAIREDFDVYVAAGRQNRGDMFFTGYYIPVLHGSYHKSDRYRYPIHLPPKGRNGQRGASFSHEEIASGALDGKGLELVWVDDRLDLFFLQVQGSGIVKLESGGTMYVGYAATNGHPYRAVGKLLIDEGKISRADISMQTIRDYLTKHPEEMDRVLFYNPSYVFFKETGKVGIGSLGCSLVDGRAVAMDKNIFPKGALAFVETTKPELDDKGEIVRWVPFSRFVLNQDTGGAIKGPGRADFFWGKGKYAQAAAGCMKQEGRLFFLVKKRKR